MKRVSRDELLAMLRDHIHATLVKLNGDFYRLISSIPQGSILSNLIANLYLARLESQGIRPSMAAALSTHQPGRWTWESTSIAELTTVSLANV